MAKGKSNQTGGQNAKAKGTKITTGGATTVRAGLAKPAKNKGVGTR
jgi:hypothetical protein